MKDYDFLSSEQPRDRILQAALKVFSERSFHESTMDEVAQRAQISKGGVYLHFSSKQDLFISLIEAATRMLLSSMESEMGKVDGRREKMKAAIQAAFALLEKHRTIARLVFLRIGGLGPLFDEKVFAAHGKIARLIQTQLDAAITEEDLPVTDSRLMSLMWTGAIYEVLVWWLHEEHPASSLQSLSQPLYESLIRSAGLEPE